MKTAKRGEMPAIVAKAEQPAPELETRTVQQARARIARVIKTNPETGDLEPA